MKVELSQKEMKFLIFTMETTKRIGKNINVYNSQDESFGIKALDRLYTKLSDLLKKDCQKNIISII